MSDEEYEVSLLDQRRFGSGLKRKRIQFVPSSRPQTGPSSRTDQEVTAAEKYLAIVLNKRRPVSRTQDAVLEQSADGEPVAATQSDGTSEQLCEICSKPVTNKDAQSMHDNSLVHQICMKHSHPPSHLDRGRKGLAVLQSYGWDPDDRRGLGAAGEGILHPIKATDNAARTGIGAVIGELKPTPKPVRLDAGKTRTAEKSAQKHKDKLREAFYRDEKIEKYLGQLDERSLCVEMSARLRPEKAPAASLWR